jgi:hypothetical protein
VAYFDIGKQKVVWILKCREQHEEAAGNALREAYKESTLRCFFVIFWTYSLYIRNRLPYRESAGNALRYLTLNLINMLSCVNSIRVLPSHKIENESTGEISLGK